MKLLSIFPVSFFFALVQNVGARPYPEDSTGYFGNWFGYKSVVSDEGTNLLTQGTNVAKQVIGSVSKYGKMGMEMTEQLGKTAVDAVSNLAETGTEAVSSFANKGLTRGQKLITNGTEKVRSGMETILDEIKQMIQRIENLASAVRQYFRSD